MLHIYHILVIPSPLLHLLISIFFCEALNDFERQRAELINTLAIQDCSYSKLEEHIAEFQSFSTSNFDIQLIVDDV